MKNRIISFFLVLIMLFSCLSLNIFAADGAEAEVTEEAATANTEAEIYEQLGIGRKNSYGLTVEELEAALAKEGRTALINGELTAQSYYGKSDRPLGLQFYDGVAMWLDYTEGELAEGTTPALDAQGADQDIPLLNWIKIAGKTETLTDSTENAYLKWQKPVARYFDGKYENNNYVPQSALTLQEAFATETVDGVEWFTNETLKGYQTEGRYMLSYLYNETTKKYDYERELFNPENVRNYFKLCTQKEDGTPYDLGEEYDGELYYTYYKTGEYVQCYLSYNSIANAQKELIKEDSKAGASYVITLDIRNHGAKDFIPFEMRSYVTGGKLASVSFTSVQIKQNGEIWYSPKNGSYEPTGATIGVYDAETNPDWYQLTLWHTPRGIDGIKGTEDDNTYHLFLNGKMIATATALKGSSKVSGVYYDYEHEFEYEGNTYNTATDYIMTMVRFAQDSADVDMMDVDDFRVYYGEPVECVHEWEYSHKHDTSTNVNTYMAKCTVCGKLETATANAYNDTHYGLSQSELADALTANGGTALKNAELVIDPTKPIETQTPFGLSYSNGTARIKSGSTEIINWRQITNATDGDGNVYMKWQRPVLIGPDNTTLDLSIDETTKEFNNAALQAYVGKAITYYKTASSASVTETFTTAEEMKTALMSSGLISIEDGIPYYTGPMASEYVQLYNRCSNSESFASAYKQSSNLGASYAITLDFIHYGNDQIPLLELSTYLPPTQSDADAVISGITTNTAGTSVSFGTNNKRGGPYPLYINSDGTIRYVDGGTTGFSHKNLDKNIATIPANVWTQLTFYHTPRGLDGIKGTDDDNTYHLFLDGRHVLTATFACSLMANDITVTLPDGVTNSAGTKLNINLKDYDTGKYFVANGLTITYNPATDYICNLARVCQKGVKYDLMGMDDFRIYYGDLVECAHTNVDGTSSIENGVCKWCKKTVAFNCDVCERDVAMSGQTVGKNAAIVGTSLTLTDSIDINLHLELTEAIKNDESAKIVLRGADGRRTTEYALKDLTLIPEGEIGAGTYKVTLPLRSIDMTKAVTAELYQGDEKLGMTYTTTVADYLNALYSTTENDTEKALVEATLNYGAYAQKYFAVKNGDAALDDLLPNTDVTDAVADAAPAADVDATIEGDAATVTGVSLILTSTTKIKIYFTVADGLEPEVSAGELGTDAESGEYYVILDGVMPKMLGEQSTVTITAGDATTSISISVYNCIEGILGAGDEAYVNLAKALYLFGEAAANYKA